MKALGLVFVLAATIGLGGSKERAWQEGMLLNPENNAYFLSVARSEENGPGAFARGTATGLPENALISVKEHFVVDAPDAAYLVERTRLSTSPATRLFITMQVKFFVEKSKVYVLDRDGKEVELKLLKQSRKGSLAAGQ